MRPLFLALLTTAILLAGCKPKQQMSTSQIKEVDRDSCAAPAPQTPEPTARPAAEPALGTNQPDPTAESVAFQDASTFQNPDMQVVSTYGDEPTTGTTEGAETSGLALADGGCNGSGTPQKAKLTAAEEELLIRNAYDYATKKVKAEQSGLGSGWMGNVTGCGPKCNQVHDAYQPHINQYLKEQLQGQNLQYLTPVTVFDSGALPYDMSAHVYMGIGTKPQQFGEKPVLKSWVDPWRYGNATQYKPGTGPNSPDDVIDSY